MERVVEVVETLTSVNKTFARKGPVVSIQKEAIDATISMNVPMEHTSVTKMHNVKMLRKVIRVLVTMVIQARYCSQRKVYFNKP